MRSATFIIFSQQILIDRLLQDFNLNPTLKLFFYPLVTASNNKEILQYFWIKLIVAETEN